MKPHCMQLFTEGSVAKTLVVSLLDSESSGPGFESCSGHLLDLFLVVLILNPWPRLYIANWLPPTSWGF